MALAGFVGWQLSEGIARAADLSGQSRRFTGSYETRNMSGNDFPRVSWLNDRPAPIDVESWRLRVFGASERELVLSYDDLDGRREVTATIDCTGGWAFYAALAGAFPLGDLIRGRQSVGRRAQRRGEVGHRVLQEVLDGGGAGISARHSCYRRKAVSRAWVSAQAGGAGQARVRVG